MDVFGTQNIWYLEQLVKATKNSFNALSFEAITVDGTVKSLTVPTKATYALITVESSATGAAVRFLELGGAGTQPTTTVGIPRSAGDVFNIYNTSNLTNFRITQAQAGTHTINVQYYTIS